MKELFSAFGSEVFRPLVTLLLPGGLAISSWVVGVLQTWPPLYELVDRNRSEAIAVLIAAMIALGLLLEDIGSTIESRVFDRRLDEALNGLHTEEWFKYLRLAFVVEPVGARYIRTLVMRLKFELGMALACTTAALGLFTLSVPVYKIGVAAITLVAAGALLLREAWKTAATLHRVRHELLQGITVIGRQ